MQQDKTGLTGWHSQESGWSEIGLVLSYLFILLDIQNVVVVTIWIHLMMNVYYVQLEPTVSHMLIDAQPVQ